MSWRATSWRTPSSSMPSSRERARNAAVARRSGARISAKRASISLHRHLGEAEAVDLVEAQPLLDQLVEHPPAQGVVVLAGPALGEAERDRPLDVRGQDRDPRPPPPGCGRASCGVRAPRGGGGGAAARRRDRQGRRRAAGRTQAASRRHASIRARHGPGRRRACASAWRRSIAASATSRRTSSTTCAGSRGRGSRAVDCSSSPSCRSPATACST